MSVCPSVCLNVNISVIIETSDTKFGLLFMHLSNIIFEILDATPTAQVIR